MALWAGLMKFNADFQAVPYVASKVTPNADGSVWTFTIRKDSKWSDGSPCTAKDFEYSWKRQLDPASKAPYAAFLYDLKNGQAFNKGQITDAGQVGVKAKDDWTLEVTLEGPRGYFPVLSAYLAALPGHKGAIEKHGDKWTEPGNIVSNGPFTLEAWDHQKQLVLRKNKHFFDAKDVTLEKVIIPIIGVQAGALPYENNEIDLTALQAADLKRIQGDPKTSKEVFRYPYPGHVVPHPAGDEAALRQPAGAQGPLPRRGPGVRRQGGPGLLDPGPLHDSPGFPGFVDDKKIKDLQRFDAKQAMAMLKGTPYEGGKNWPKVVLSMRDEALQSKPMAEAVQAVLLENLNLKTELEVLEPRVFRERLWKQDLQLVWIRWFMDYPDPHNEYFDTFYSNKPTREAPGLVERALRQGAGGGPRHARYEEAARALPEGGGAPPVGRRLRAGGVGGPLRRGQAVGPRPREEQGRRAGPRGQHLRGHALPPVRHREGIGKGVRPCNPDDRRQRGVECRDCKA